MARLASTYRANKIAPRTADGRTSYTSVNNPRVFQHPAEPGRRMRCVTVSPWVGDYRSLAFYKEPSVRAAGQAYQYVPRRVRGKSYRAAEAAKIAAILHPAKPKRVRKPRVKKEVQDVG